MSSFVDFHRLDVLSPLIVDAFAVVHADYGGDVAPLIGARRLELRPCGLVYVEAAVFCLYFPFFHLLYDCRGGASNYFQAVGDNENVFRGVSELSVYQIWRAGFVRALVLRPVGSGRQIDEVNECDAARFRAPTFVTQDAKEANGSCPQGLSLRNLCKAKR